MANTTGLIAKNIRRFRADRHFSQKEVCSGSGIPQGQYSRIENAKVEPSISTLEKLAVVFEVEIADFFKSDEFEQSEKLSLLQKIKLIDKLDTDEQQALMKIIDLALANKQMKENIQTLITQ